MRRPTDGRSAGDPSTHTMSSRRRVRRRLTDITPSSRCASRSASRSCCLKADAAHFLSRVANRPIGTPRTRIGTDEGEPGRMSAVTDAADARPRIVRPMTAIVDRLRTSARLGVLILVLLVPGIGATYSYIGQINGQVDFAASELSGTVVVRQALLALADTAGGRSPDLGPLRAAVDAHPELALAEEMAAVDDRAAGTPPERLALTGALAAVITEAGNTSKLILDPDLDSYFIMDLHIVQVPKMLVAAANAAVLSADGSVADRAINAGDPAAAARAFRSDVDTAQKNSRMTDLATRLAALAAAADAADAFAAPITGSLDDPVPADPAPLVAADRRVGRRHRRRTRERGRSGRGGARGGGDHRPAGVGRQSGHRRGGRPGPGGRAGDRGAGGQPAPGRRHGGVIAGIAGQTLLDGVVDADGG